MDHMSFLTASFPYSPIEFNLSFLSKLRYN
jgi:hypothetical protein